VNAARRLALLAPLVLACGCSSGSFTVPQTTDGGADTTPDTATSDAGADAKPTETGTLECRDPSNCGSLTPHCCATFDLGAGSLPSCPLSNAETKCRAVCNTQIPLSCPASGQVKLCRDSKDCVSDLGNPNCCKILASGVIGSFCVSDLIKGYAMSCN
jgi:hypothetical protein